MCVIVLSKIEGGFIPRERGGGSGGGGGTNRTDFWISNTRFDASKMIKLSTLATPLNIKYIWG